jgi:uncharacterized protein YcsI (UPF0317 family)
MGESGGEGCLLGSTSSHHRVCTKQGYDGAARLGISDILQPEFGDPPIIASDEVPVFWGCGVTPQLVVMSSRVEGVVAAHAPGKMICLDLKVAQTF